MIYRYKNYYSSYDSSSYSSYSSYSATSYASVSYYYGSCVSRRQLLASYADSGGDDDYYDSHYSAVQATYILLWSQAFTLLSLAYVHLLHTGPRDGGSKRPFISYLCGENGVVKSMKKCDSQSRRLVFFFLFRTAVILAMILLPYLFEWLLHLQHPAWILLASTGTTIFWTMLTIMEDPSKFFGKRGHHQVYFERHQGSRYWRVKAPGRQTPASSFDTIPRQTPASSHDSIRRAATTYQSGVDSFQHMHTEGGSELEASEFWEGGVPRLTKDDLERLDLTEAYLHSTAFSEVDAASELSEVGGASDLSEIDDPADRDRVASFSDMSKKPSTSLKELEATSGDLSPVHKTVAL